MKMGERVDAASVAAQAATNLPTKALPSGRWLARLRSPLWLCLLLALLVRVWLIIHTRGFIDADEALVGVQAQHILQGERPIYYYGQPYMGSLEAYLLAGMFALAGSSVWSLRAVTTLLSLLLVSLTWVLAGALAQEARLSPPARRWFMMVAGLVAACPPLYDLVMELRAWGGHVETYILILSLLYAAPRFVRRWSEGAMPREMAWRWAAIGLIIGVGLWIYPLIICAVLTLIAWIAVFLARRLLPAFRISRVAGCEALKAYLPTLRLAIYALPACLFGFSPGIYWGAQNGWANVLYLLSPGSDGGNNATFLRHHDRLALLIGTMQLYGRCLVPEVLGGSLPSQSLTSSSFYSFCLITIVGIAALLLTTGLIAASFFRQSPLLLMIRNLAGLPLLFAYCTIFIFCFSSTVGNSIFEPCTRDGVGRYAAPILLPLPLIGAALSVIAYSLYAQRDQGYRGSSQSQEQTVSGGQRSSFRLHLKSKSVLLAVIFYLLMVGNTYVQSDSNYIFQSFTCLSAPANNQALIDYMQSRNIHYAWGTIVLGNPLMFKTHSRIVVADPRIILDNALDRLPQNVQAVEKAPYASLLDMVPHADRYPLTLQALDQANILYRVARFPSVPGSYDVLVITPVNRTLTPSEASSYGSWSLRC